jgi:hypothetical protein
LKDSIFQFIHRKHWSGSMNHPVAIDANIEESNFQKIIYDTFMTIELDRPFSLITLSASSLDL